jgi:hypothetical protein
MNDEPDLAARGRAIVDANLYMVLATADEAGRPWATPVYFAPSAYRDFFWVSEPDARHSRNLAARADVSIVIFDSTVPISTGQAVYMSATARSSPGTSAHTCSSSTRAAAWRTADANGLSRTWRRRPGCASTGQPPRSSTCSTSTTIACR